MTTVENEKYKQSLQSDYKCDHGPESKITDYDSGEICCKDCGIVSERILDTSYERRVFNPEEKKKKSRSGPPLTYARYDLGLSTHIDPRIKGKRNLSYEEKNKLFTLIKWQNRIRVSSVNEKNLATALNDLERLRGYLKLPKVLKEEAAIKYRKALEKGLVKGRAIIGITTASLYLVARQRGIARSPGEFAKAAQLKKTDVTRYYRLLKRELEEVAPFQNSDSYINTICNKLELSGATELLALKIAKVAKEKKITQGKDPKTVAAAAVYRAGLITNERKSQREIAGILKITEVSVRNRLKDSTAHIKEDEIEK